MQIEPSPDSQLDSHALAPKEADAALFQLRSAFLFEAQQQLTALAQFGNRDATVQFVEQPPESSSVIGSQAQLIGRAAADMIPAVITGLTMRFGLSKMLPAVETARSLILKRSPLGLNALEAGATGLTTGFALKPSDEDARQNLSSFLLDRAGGGVMSALSFTTLTGLNAVTGFAGERLGGRLLKTALSNPISGGVLSGALAGPLNTQFDSLAQTGHLSVDSAKMVTSAYEMAMIGGIFAAGTVAVGRLTAGVHKAKSPVLAPLPAREPLRPGFATIELRLTPAVFLVEAGKPSVAGAGQSPAELRQQFAVDTAPRPTLATSALANDRSAMNPEKPALDLAQPKEQPANQPTKPKMEADKLIAIANASSEQTLAIRKMLGKESTDRLLAIEEVDLKAVSDFLAQSKALGKQAVEALIEAGANSKHLSEPQISVFAEIHNLWKAPPEVTAHLLKQGPDVLSMLSDLPDYLRQDPGTRIAQVEHMIESGAPIAHLNPGRLAALAQLEKVFSDRPEVVSKILALESEHVNLPRLVEHLEKYSNASSRLRVERIVESNPKPEQLNASRLNLLAHLEKSFGAGSAMQQIEKMNGNSLLNLDRYLKGRNVEVKIEHIKQLADRGASLAELNPLRLMGIDTINELLGCDPPLKARLLSLESKGLSLGEVGAFLSKAGPAQLPEARALLSKLIEEEAPSLLDQQYLKARLQLPHYFSSKPQTVAALIDLANQGLDLKEINRFISRHQSMTEARATLVAEEIDRGIAPDKLGYERLNALEKLHERFDEKTVHQLLLLENARTPLTAVANFTGQSHEHENLLQEFIKETEGNKPLDLQQLMDQPALQQLARYFPADSATFKQIAAVHKEGSLSALRLAKFVAEDQSSRARLVAKLASEEADGQRFNAHMRLSILPDEAAYRVVKAIEQKELSLPSLLRKLRSLERGEAFTSLLTEHALAGRPLTNDTIAKLYARALVESAQPAKSAGYASDGLRTSHQRPEIGQLSQTIAASSEALQQAAVRIDQFIPADKTVVLLGRDTWPLVPVLRARGRDVQYFLWTRLQNEDASTMKQWLKEVPLQSAIVDTGFRGTIFDVINKIDPSATGYLMNSETHYRQLLPFSSSEKVNAIENIPKMIGRSASYTEAGNAVSRQSYRDDGDQARDFTSRNSYRWSVEKETEQLLRALGLSEWEVWRYRDYVGLTARERLGVDSDQQVQAHYDEVARSRTNQH